MYNKKKKVRMLQRKIRSEGWKKAENKEGRLE